MGDPARIEHEVAIGGVPLFKFEELDSTNTRARELLAAGVRPPFVVHADRQTAGRGRAGRTWHSPPGVLTASWVVDRPAVPARVALIAGLAVCRAVQDLSRHVNLLLKWPNDVVLADLGAVFNVRTSDPRRTQSIRFRKIAGVLCEAADESLIVGIGVNVAVDVAALPADVAGIAGTLGLPTEDVPRLRDGISGHLLTLVRSTEASDGWQQTLAELEQRDALRGQRVTVDTGGLPLVGTAAGLDEAGRLLVDSPGGRQVISTGTVRLCPTASDADELGDLPYAYDTAEHAVDG